MLQLLRKGVLLSDRGVADSDWRALRSSGAFWHIGTHSCLVTINEGETVEA